MYLCILCTNIYIKHEIYFLLFGTEWKYCGKHNMLNVHLLLPIIINLFCANGFCYHFESFIINGYYVKSVDTSMLLISRQWLNITMLSTNIFQSLCMGPKLNWTDGRPFWYIGKFLVIHTCQKRFCKCKKMKFSECSLKKFELHS